MLMAVGFSRVVAVKLGGCDSGCRGGDGRGLAWI